MLERKVGREILNVRSTGLQVIAKVYNYYIQYGTKHVAVSGFCNIIVNLLKLCVFVGLSYSNFIVKYRVENVKNSNIFCSCDYLKTTVT